MIILQLNVIKKGEKMEMNYNNYIKRLLKEKDIWEEDLVEAYNKSRSTKYAIEIDNIKIKKIKKILKDDKIDNISLDRILLVLEAMKINLSYSISMLSILVPLLIFVLTIGISYVDFKIFTPVFALALIACFIPFFYSFMKIDKANENYNMGLFAIKIAIEEILEDDFEKEGVKTIDPRKNKIAFKEEYTYKIQVDPDFKENDFKEE